VVVGEGFVNQQLIGILKLVDLYTGREYGTINGHNKYIHCVAYSSNGAYLATGSFDGAAKVWDVKQVKEDSE
jgi:WD40 repeat protein